MKREVIDTIDDDDEQERGSKRGSYARHKYDLSAAKFRSALTNGTTLLSGDVDLRAANARRYRDVIAAHAIDLGGDGKLSEAQKALIRRFAMAQLLTEVYESIFITRLDDDDREGEAQLYGTTRLAEYVRFALLQVKLSEVLGLDRGRQPRDVSPVQQRNRNTDRVIEAIERGHYE